MYLILALSAGGNDHNKYTCAFLLPLALMPPSFASELRSGNCHEYSSIYVERHYLEEKKKKSTMASYCHYLQVPCKWQQFPFIAS
jgi:hypothetical protein